MYSTDPNAMKRPTFELPKLPFDEDALEPVISARTMAAHYGEHHRGYVDKLNALVRDDELAFMPLDELVRKTAHMPSRRDVSTPPRRPGTITSTGAVSRLGAVVCPKRC
jgi:superoxide dismutase